jgi:hypothetical protein
MAASVDEGVPNRMRTECRENTVGGEALGQGVQGHHHAGRTEANAVLVNVHLGCSPFGN